MTKLSVSLPPADIEFIDAIAVQYEGNRSAAIHDLVRLGRELAAGDAYAEAFDEWESSGDAAAWESTAAEGLAR
ncbi:antitoxin [Agromyces bracchium]|uniref:Antitoxin n=1 Tax=Agromyces bracchium TaxID=88376 RepID=A0A6I3M4N3_9MICO|nr:antitoxin [Agromyces bracchium]MTH67851.1 antitoxin [Agromyces bracchium]